MDKATLKDILIAIIILLLIHLSSILSMVIPLSVKMLFPV